MHVTGSFMGKDLFKVQDRQMDFNVTEFTEFTDTVSDSTLQPAFKKLLPVEVWCSIKVEYPQLSEKNYLKVYKTFFSSTTTYLCKAGFFSTTICCNRLNAEADMRIHLSSNKPGNKEIRRKTKSKTMPLVSLILGGTGLEYIELIFIRNVTFANLF